MAALQEALPRSVSFRPSVTLMLLTAAETVLPEATPSLTRKVRENTEALLTGSDRELSYSTRVLPFMSMVQPPPSRQEASRSSRASVP